MYIPLTFVQIHLPFAVLKNDDVYIFRIQEWKTNSIYNNTVTSFSFDLTIKDSSGGYIYIFKLENIIKIIFKFLVIDVSNLATPI